MAQGDQMLLEQFRIDWAGYAANIAGVNEIGKVKP